MRKTWFIAGTQGRLGDFDAKAAGRAGDEPRFSHERSPRSCATTRGCSRGLTMAQVGRSRQLRWSPSAQVEFRASRALKRRKKSSAPWAIAAKWRIPVRWVAEGPLEPGCQGTDSGAYPPRQSHCHRDLGRLVFRLRSDRRRSGREGIAGRQFLHGAWRRCALRGNEGGSRNCLHYRIWSFRYGLRQVRPHAVELFETLLPSSVVAIVPLPLPRGKREGVQPLTFHLLL